MLKDGYDNFEVTKRPPEVEVCEKKYVFNQQAGGPFNASSKCPVMTTPPALQTALLTYDKQYDADYATAMKKYSDMAWYDPTEAERKAIVAKQRKGHDIAYAPTGTALAAGKMMKVADLESMMANQSGQQLARGATVANPSTASIRMATAAPGLTGRQGAQPADIAVAANIPANVPVPTANPMVNPLAYAPSPVETAQTEPAKKPPFWKFWAKSE
jgi:hypothetical protein